MSRKDDVVNNFMKFPAVTVIESEKILTLLEQAVSYGFEQGESFGKYGAFIKKQNEKLAEEIIQPENDRAWKKELDDIMKDCRNTTCRSNESKTVRLLGLIAEMILYTRRGDGYEK